MMRGYSRKISDSSTPINIVDVPMHFLPLEASRNPSGQEQRKLPGLLVHEPSHPPFATAHSSTSATPKDNKDKGVGEQRHQIKWYRFMRDSMSVFSFVV